MIYASYIDGQGSEFFRVACERDLEGIVAKLKDGVYGQGCLRFAIRIPSIRGPAGPFREETDSNSNLERSHS